jgi:hypothetical protein
MGDLATAAVVARMAVRAHDPECRRACRSRLRLVGWTRLAVRARDNAMKRLPIWLNEQRIMPSQPVAAGGAGADGAAVGAGVTGVADRQAAGMPSGHSAPLDQPVQRAEGQAGLGDRPRSGRPPAGRQAAGQADRRVAERRGHGRCRGSGVSWAGQGQHGRSAPSNQARSAISRACGSYTPLSPPDRPRIQSPRPTAPGAKHTAGRLILSAAHQAGGRASPPRH